MIKRLASAPKKRGRKASVALGSKSPQARRTETRKRSRPEGKTSARLGDYPLETEGSRLAADARATANKLSDKKRAALFKKGMAMIYGSAGIKAARAGH